MNLNQKLNRRIFAGLSASLLGASLIAFSLLKPARQNQSDEAPLNVEQLSEETDESSRRAEGLRFRRLSLQDENGVIDPDGLRNAGKQIEKMKTVQRQRRQRRERQIEEAGVAPDSWDWLGPGNIGGRIRSIVIKPNNPNDMLVGSVSGGIWRTTNAGASWSPVNDFMANLAVTTMIINPANPNIMYAGTGEGFGNIDNIQGAGIFRSDDGGTSWNQLAATNNANFNFVNRLAISPTTQTLLAATNTGIWRSADGGTNWFRQTTTPAMDIDFRPDGLGNMARSGENGFARFSLDDGQTWTAASFNPAISNGGTSATNGRVETASVLSNTSIVYAAVNQNNGELYRSNDGGRSYTQVNTGTNFFLGGGGNQGWYDNAIWLNPQDPDTVIVGGIHLWRGKYNGTTFNLPLTQISDSSSGSAHPDHHVIVAHPGFNNSTNRIVYFGNDGGIYRADDAPTIVSWTNLNNNLGITQFHGGAGNQSTGVIIGGTQDNGTLRFNGGTQNWTQFDGSDGGFCAADQTDPNYFYGEIQNLGVFRSSDAGLSRVFIRAGIGDVPPNCGRPMQQACQTNFIAPITLDPNEPNRLLAGGWSLWRTNDARATTPQWASIKNPTGGNSPISAITISPNNSDFIVVGHNNGDVFLTLNGTAVTPIWSKIDTAGLADRMVTRLLIDTNRSPNWIYATFGGFSADNVSVSRNLGVTWTDVTGTGATGLPDVPVRSLVFHPSKADLLYAGTEIGIFTSEDGGTSWDLPNGGPANVSVDELFWIGGDLIAATHGRGMFRASGGIYVDCNFTGIPDGTFARPYKTVNAAINAVTRYTPIWLKPCNYNETINTRKRLEIRSLGGAATVGTP